MLLLIDLAKIAEKIGIPNLILTEM